MTGFEVRRSTREPLNALSVSLAHEFSDRVPTGTVIRSVAQAREALLAVGVRAGLVVAVESMTRARLHALAASSGSASSDVADGALRVRRRSASAADGREQTPHRPGGWALPGQGAAWSAVSAGRTLGSSLTPLRPLPQHDEQDPS